MAPMTIGRALLEFRKQLDRLCTCATVLGLCATVLGLAGTMLEPRLWPTQYCHKKFTMSETPEKILYKSGKFSIFIACFEKATHAHLPNFV